MPGQGAATTMDRDGAAAERLPDETRNAMSEESNKQLVAEAFDAWAAGTGGVFDLLAEDADWTIVGNSVASGTYPTRQAFLDTVITPFNARMSSPLVPSVRALYADGDTVVALFDASATVRDGSRYDNTYAWFLTMREHRIVSAVAFFDSVEFNDFWARVQPA
jgi:ketosteroid isomerase-like protein